MHFSNSLYKRYHHSLLHHPYVENTLNIGLLWQCFRIRATKPDHRSPVTSLINRIHVPTYESCVFERKVGLRRHLSWRPLNYTQTMSKCFCMVCGYGGSWNLLLVLLDTGYQLVLPQRLSSFHLGTTKPHILHLGSWNMEVGNFLNAVSKSELIPIIQNLSPLPGGSSFHTFVHCLPTKNEWSMRLPCYSIQIICANVGTYFHQSASKLTIGLSRLNSQTNSLPRNAIMGFVDVQPRASYFVNSINGNPQCYEAASLATVDKTGCYLTCLYRIDRLWLIFRCIKHQVVSIKFPQMADMRLPTVRFSALNLVSLQWKCDYGNYLPTFLFRDSSYRTIHCYL